MSTIGYTWWLATEALTLLIRWWPGTIAFVLLFIASFRFDAKRDSGQMNSLPSMLFLFPVLVLVWSGIGRVDEPQYEAWRFVVLGIILMLQLAATCALIYVARGARWTTTGYALLIGWFTFACVRLAVDALSGQLPAIP